MDINIRRTQCLEININVYTQCLAQCLRPNIHHQITSNIIYILHHVYSICSQGFQYISYPIMQAYKATPKSSPKSKRELNAWK